MDIVGNMMKKTKTWVLLLGCKEKQTIQEDERCIALGHSCFSYSITVGKLSKKIKPQSFCFQTVEILTKAEHRNSSKPSLQQILN